jgi:hypothetical protein
MTVLTIMYAGIAGLADGNQNARELWVSSEECNGYSGPCTGNVTATFDNHPAAERVSAAMKSGAQYTFVLFIMTQKPTAQLVPRRQCMVDAASFLWMISSHIQPRI